MRRSWRGALGAIALIVPALPVATPEVHADAADDLPRILRTRELKREGSFEQALTEAAALLAESEAASRPSFEIRNRRVQVEILRDILSRPAAVREEIVQAEQDWWNAWSFYGEGKYREAEIPSRRALEIRTRHFGEHHYDVATSVAQMGLFLSLQNRYDEAEPLLLRTLELYNEILGESSAAAATAHNDLATMYSATANQEKAEQHFRIHLQLFREYHSENEESIASALGNLAVTLGRRGDPASATPLLHEALRIRRRIHPQDHPSIGLALNLIGSNCYARGDVITAEALYREALEVRERALGPDHPDVSVSLTNLAIVLSKRGELREALAMHERSLAIRMERFGEDHRKTARTLQNLGDTHWKLDDPDRAEDFFRRARAITAKIHGQRHPGVASIDRCLARLEAGRGNLDEAEALFRQSLDVYLESHGPEHKTVAASHGYLGDLALRRRDWTAAVGHLQASLASYEAVRRRFKTPVDRASFHSSPDLRLAVALLELGREEEAWPHVERARGRLLGDLVQVAAPEASGFPSTGYGREAAWDAVQGSLRLGTALAGWVDVALRDTPPMVWGWVLRNEGPVRWVRLEAPPAATDGEPLTAHLREALVLAGSWPFRLGYDASVDRNARAIGAHRLSPLLPYLNGVRSLVVVPSGPMHGIPVESLADAGGLPFGSRWTISYSPSPAIHAWLAGRSGATRLRTALLLGDPPGAPPFGPLPGARDEVARLAGLFPEARVLVGAEANEKTLVSLARSETLATFDAVHLATHAVADPDRPERSTLVLAAPAEDGLTAALAGTRIHDGYLTVDEIVREWHLNADLVTLSGCGTALGRRMAGEGFLGFAHAFFQAGARSLVLSLWKVDDEATSLLMSRFYENMVHRQLGKAEALREARAWLREWQDASGEARFQHPAYWSAFVLIGDPGTRS